MSTVNPRRHAVVLGLFAAILLSLGAVEFAFRGSNVWASLGGETPRGSSYAERVRPANVSRTLTNTWSNLGFVLVGLYAISFGWSDRRRTAPVPDGQKPNLLRSTPAHSILFGISCVYLGIGSGLYHASLTRWGQHLDVAAMYTPLVVLIAFNLDRWLPRVRGRRTWPLWIVAVLVTSVLLYIYKWSMSSRVVLPGLILAVANFLLLDLINRRMRWRDLLWPLLALATLVLAVTCRQLDVAGRFTGPDSWVQGHALWHLLTAGTLACMFVYYRGVRDMWQQRISPASNS